jgi:glycogen operon protein
MMNLEFKIKKGYPLPLGATCCCDGINFSLYSESAEYVKLLLFNYENLTDPFIELTLNRDNHCQFHIWNIFLEGLKSTNNNPIYYGYIVKKKEKTFINKKFLIDPYAKAIEDKLFIQEDSMPNNVNNFKTSLRGVVVDKSVYNWEDDKAPMIPIEKSIIYEMHVKGFSFMDKTISAPGTFMGIIEKIPYLKELGVNVIELLPTFEFDSKNRLSYIRDKEKFLTDYWGYNSINFFALKKSYCQDQRQLDYLNEFKDMVKLLHREGIEVILDVVYNHTAECNQEEGSIINFKGLDEKVYYQLDKNAQCYLNYSGCGNTVNCNHPIVRKQILDSLKYWAKEMHVDGFRFDEATVLSRDTEGKILESSPLLWDIELSEDLIHKKLIAEVWDVASSQLGNFGGYRWSEWNAHYRDTIKRFIKGEPGISSLVANKIGGNSDIYLHKKHTPINSINYISSHDGSTMYDIVSYEKKHNEANAENNLDGPNEFLSWNCGVEGETEDPDIIFLRKKQMKNFITILMLSRGVPMILAGDEMCRTQFGNNNAYCQDNEISWINWDLLDKNQDIFRFFKMIINFRKQVSALTKNGFYNGKDTNMRGFKDIEWHGQKVHNCNFEDSDSKLLSFTIASFNNAEPDLHVMLNMHETTRIFEIPAITDNRKWYFFIDTNKPSPKDILDEKEVVLHKRNTCAVRSHSCIVLISK